jgi:hypothetical protein
MTFGGKGVWTAIGEPDQSSADAIVGRAIERQISQTFAPPRG